MVRQTWKSWAFRADWAFDFSSGLILNLKKMLKHTASKFEKHIKCFVSLEARA